ncbi:Toll-like receptor 7 [Bagarius yarrelli]|uniref:Toll-like receptor 7 n=1 Tax=Bagarius yarrelli TaxID=175774 RepID=A0A556V919_BAGYA|nr:Toll-like receptor 7 [Bagarius yarrelli]
MTESSELAAAQKLSDNSLKMFVARAEGYQTLVAEKTEFRLRATSRNQKKELKSTAVASCQVIHLDNLEIEPGTAETKLLPDYFNKTHMDNMMGKRQEKVDEEDFSLRISRKNESSQIKTAGSNIEDEVGRYNNANSREAFHTGFDFQRTPFSFQDKNILSQQILHCNAEEHVYSKIPKCNSSNAIALSNLTSSPMDLNTQSAAEEAYLIQQDTHKQESRVQAPEKEVTRSYHLTKRMSSLQSEGIHSLQSSQCSSIDAGCSTGSSGCVMPMDSPLCTLKSLGYSNTEERGYSQSPHRKLLHQTLDPINGTEVKVDCTNRRLTSVPPGIPSNTTNLTLTINHIPYVNNTSFLGLNNITEIDMRCNCVPIKIGPKDHVCMQSVQIDNGSFWQLKTLKSLYLDGNQLFSIPKGLPGNVVLLSLEVNSISSILKENLTELINIKILYLGQNCYFRNPCNKSYHVEQDAFLQLEKLTLLSLKSNNLSYVPHKLPSSLKELYLYNNNIEKVAPEDFHNLTELEILDLSGNCPRCYNAPFPCIPCPDNAPFQIHQHSFLNLTKLKILRLHSNSLTSVDPQWFNGCKELQMLDLSSNFLAKDITHTYFPHSLPFLEELDLSFNYELQRYPSSLNLSLSFSSLKNLRILRIRGFVFQELKQEDIQPLIFLEKLEMIDLGTNFIKLTNLSILTRLKNFHIINLSDNKISSPSEAEHATALLTANGFPKQDETSPMSLGIQYKSGEVREIHYFRYDEYARSCKSKDKELGTLSPFNTQCSSFGKALDLSRNNIFFLHSRFLNLHELRCLNLSGNAMSQALNGSEFVYLKNLTYLDFSHNRLDLMFSSAFRELSSLIVLDISHNNYYFEAEGLTHMLNFTKNLDNLNKLVMNHNQISTSTNTEMESSSLEYLEFKGNRLDLLWRDGDTRYHHYFKKLKILKSLDISHNNLNYIPKQVLQNLPKTLTEFNITNNKLKAFYWDGLKFLPNLKILDLSSNHLTSVPAKLSNCSKSIAALVLRKNQIIRLSPEFLQGAVSLKEIDLSYNKIKFIEESSFPENVIDKLEVLYLNNNRFVCSCNATWFVRWVNHTSVYIPRLATDVTCASPGTQRGQSVISLNLQACQHNSLSIIFNILTMSVILSVLTLSISSHLFLWDVWYIYHFCLAKVKGYRHLHSENTAYDAFVVYDKTDTAVSDWVLQELRVQLEESGQPRLQLCLEDRDWVVGCPLIENLSQSIQLSKRTIFILTTHFIQSGHFKMAFYLAHQRLMDEKDDVIILIFLERFSFSHSKYLRLRRRLYKRSVMEWPRNPQAQQYFWFCLRSVMATKSQQHYNKLFQETLYAVCRLDLKSLMTHRCDIQTNANGTVEFDCHGRKLSVMPHVYFNTTSLDVSKNNIKKLTVDSLKDLQKLKNLSLNWMNQNQPVNIRKGVFANLTSLEILELNGVGLLKVPAHLPNSLKQIRLDENNISSLGPKDFLKRNNLTHLYLSKNCYYRNPCLMYFDIENNTFSGLDKLEHLSLSYNNITHVPRYLPASLITLELASNMISFIREDDFKDLQNLKTLKIQGNCPRCHNAPYPCIPCANGSIDIHDRAFDKLTNLRLLQLAGNSISIIKKAWFKNMSQLRELYLSFNFLTSQIEDGAFLSNLRLLRKLDLSYNYELQVYPETVTLSPAFANLQSLRTLHIQGLVFKKIQNDTLAPLYGLQNLSTLDIGVNFIVAVDPNIFNQFPNLKLLYLSENRLYPIANSTVKNLNENMKMSQFDLAWTNTDPKKTLEPYNINKRLVKPECFAAGSVLDLSRNNLFFISPKQFEDYKHISCLNLSRNGFSSALNGTEFTSLPNLKYLDLSFNKIDLAYDYAFKELKELEVLDLSFNPHYFIVPGVTHNLKFLQNLPKLRVLNMSSNNIFTLTSKYMCSNSLVELQFQENQLGRIWRDKKYVQLFWNLTNLTHLDISHNNIKYIPKDVYKYLPVKIKRFRLNHNALISLNWTLMRTFTQLEELILSYNFLTHVSQSITRNIPSLRYIDLSHNRISQLASKLLQGVVNLEMLDLSYNKLSTINQSTFPSKLATNLSTLWLHKNPYRCTCDILDFVLWISETSVKIPYLYSLVNCNAPFVTRGKPVMGFDIKECVDNKLAFLAYLFSTLFVLGITFVSTLMQVFYWDFSYVFYYLKAKLRRYQRLSYEDNIYDAFVTYDTKDPQVSEWVLNHLRVQLEEQSDCFLPVCLEERDWLPGCPILDSLTQSIRQSRKTIFILTQSYVRSGLFKMAIYLAHQRLLDESEDVIVLLLLEPVLQNSHFLRLRRRLCSHSVLEWPQTPAAEPWFWQCLRNAVRLENKVMYNNIYSRYFTLKKRPKENK